MNLTSPRSCGQLPWVSPKKDGSGMKEESWELSRIALKGAAVVWESAALVAGEREWAQWAWLKREKLLSLGYGAWCNQRSFYVALFIKCRVKCALTSRVYYIPTVKYCMGAHK